jgi:K+-sensing histidine kinase KdpD
MTAHLLSLAALVRKGLVFPVVYSFERIRNYAQPSRIYKKGLAILHTDTASGTVSCAGIAIFLCLLLNDSEFKSNVPILFLLVVLGVTARFGAEAGTLGTVIAAFIFAELLFEPLLSFVVNNPIERANLGWMVLGGLVISNVFGRSRKPLDAGRSH